MGRTLRTYILLMKLCHVRQPTSYHIRLVIATNQYVMGMNLVSEDPFIRNDAADYPRNKGCNIPCSRGPLARWNYGNYVVVAPFDGSERFADQYRGSERLERSQNSGCLTCTESCGSFWL
jgi:hypothetical protein